MKCDSCDNRTTPCGQGFGAASGEYVGIFDIFKIGIGPSSSHTVGPMWAGYKFANILREKHLLECISRVRVDLYGSLASTGKGHGTDKAVLLGLSGNQPDTVNPDEGDSVYNLILQNREIKLNGLKFVAFCEAADLVFHMDLELPMHPNGMAITAFYNNNDSIFSEVYYSIGGGFIKTESEMLGVAPKSNSRCSEEDLTLLNDLGSPKAINGSLYDFGTNSAIPFFFGTADQLLQLSRENKMSIAEIMIENECAHLSLDRVRVEERLDSIAAAFEACVERGLHVKGFLPVSNIPRRAAQIYERLKDRKVNYEDPFAVSDWVALFARAVNEENACGGRIVTAPTNGAAGTLPATLTYYRRYIATSSPEGIREFLATAAAVGSLCKRNASISGAEAGCQAEVGSACAMAAAGLAAVMGGNIYQIENAAEIGLEHCLGLTCDPIMGLVQIPCIERNCMAAIKAITASRLALMGDGNHEVSLDSCIQTMFRTGLDMQSKYRETSTGGLALFARKILKNDL